MLLSCTRVCDCVCVVCLHVVSCQTLADKSVGDPPSRCRRRAVLPVDNLGVVEGAVFTGASEARMKYAGAAMGARPTAVRPVNNLLVGGSPFKGETEARAVYAPKRAVGLVRAPLYAGAMRAAGREIAGGCGRARVQQQQQHAQGGGAYAASAARRTARTDFSRIAWTGMRYHRCVPGGGGLEGAGHR